MFRISVPLHRLWLFPLLAGSSWLLRLSALLITWVAEGVPRYPGQSNPYVAYVSVFNGDTGVSKDWRDI
jgi:uncharacterized membrane protein